MKKRLRSSIPGTLIMTEKKTARPVTMSIITDEMVLHIYEAIKAMNDGLQAMHETLMTHTRTVKEMQDRIETLEKKQETLEKALQDKASMT